MNYKIGINKEIRWYKEGTLHREDGPAIEWASGDKEWWLNGELHREDGPAIEWASGDKEWWLNGVILTKEEWLKSLPTELQEEALFNSVFIVR